MTTDLKACLRIDRVGWPTTSAQFAAGITPGIFHLSARGESQNGPQDVPGYSVHTAQGAHILLCLIHPGLS